MKRLIVFLATWMLMTGAALAADTQQYCADLSGNWNGSSNCADGHSSTNACNLAIQENVNGASGHWTAICTTDNNWYTYTIDSFTNSGSGTWSLHGTASGAPSACQGATLSVVIPKGTAGCASGTVNGKSLSHPGYCDIPSNVQADWHWGPPDGTSPTWDSPGLAHYKQKLIQGSSSQVANFGGRKITITQSSQIHDCYPPVQFYNQSVSYVDSEDGYPGFGYMDYRVGWPDSVTYNVNAIRLNPFGMTCSDSYLASFAIDCQSGNTQFEAVTAVQTVAKEPGGLSNTVSISLDGFATNPIDEPFGLNHATMWVYSIVCGGIHILCDFLP